MQEYLNQSGIEWIVLDETARTVAENWWWDRYGQAFRGRPRLRHGAKTDHAYQCEVCNQYITVPFSAGVAGLPVHVHERQFGAYECRGPWVPLGDFHNVEFFVCPVHFSWAMIHTQEDHAFGGPVFHP